MEVDKIDEEIIGLRKKITRLQEAKNEAIVYPQVRNLIGKCFKYRNCYSIPNKKSDYWFYYTKILSVSGTWVYAQSFQIDKYGDGSYERRKMHTANSYLGNSSYISISNKVYEARKKHFLRRCVKDLK